MGRLIIATAVLANALVPPGMCVCRLHAFFFPPPSYQALSAMHATGQGDEEEDPLHHHCGCPDLKPDGIADDGASLLPLFDLPAIAYLDAAPPVPCSRNDSRLENNPISAGETLSLYYQLRELLI